RVVTFRSGASTAGEKIPLRSIAGQVSGLTPDAFAIGSGTNIGAGLSRAGDVIGQAGGAGAVVLFTDGNETEGGAVRAAVELGRKGIPVYVMPIPSGPP